MTRNFFGVLFVLVLCALLVMPGCKKDSNNASGPAVSTDNSDIPADPGGVAPSPVLNNVMPAATFAKMAGNTSRIQINLLGIIDPSTGQPIVYSLSKTGAFSPNARNLFITEDTTLQGIKLTSAGSGTTLNADVVFTVDNSGSMDEEADTIAGAIIKFANFLQASGINVQVGCVGYQYGDVNGGCNLTTAANLSAFLNRQYVTGTSRTIGMYGQDSARLATAMAAYPKTYAENAIVGICFADSLFTWRAGAQRVYINFTDEALQMNNQAQWTTAGFKSRWTQSKGSIHTVFSLDGYYWSGSTPDTTMEHENGMAWTSGTYERPWGLSLFTGGTIKIVHNDGSDLDLRTLPVTGALASSYLVEYVTSNPNVAHTVTITVKTPTADGKTIFSNVTY